jgi:hypothetical protein
MQNHYGQIVRLKIVIVKCIPRQRDRWLCEYTVSEPFCRMRQSGARHSPCAPKYGAKHPLAPSVSQWARNRGARALWNRGWITFSVTNNGTLWYHARYTHLYERGGEWNRQ